tara:strand:+ start:272 stop:379 length:108 start_codon:yes stop_codon:yes gene_type:complete
MQVERSYYRAVPRLMANINKNINKRQKEITSLLKI